MLIKALGQIVTEMSQILNKSLGGLFGTQQTPTSTTTDFYQNLVDSHKQVIGQAIAEQSEIAQTQDTNDTIKEIFLSW